MTAPTVLVVFGATGDLVKKKIIPALYLLHRQQKLPKHFILLGYSRKPWSDEDFREHARQILGGVGSDEERISFLEKLSYQQGQFDDDVSYQGLEDRLAVIDASWKICANKLFYLAIPPELYGGILNHLKASKLTEGCSAEEGWTRVIVEKPFGRDLATAEALDMSLAELFKEEQIYRIDHYLAKEMLQNILTFRFANNLFEETWNSRNIERIDIRLLETLGVEERGAFYDGVGALRDVGQNHLLQMLALTVMDRPADFSADSIRQKRADSLKEVLMPLTEVDIRHQTFRAQYDGYQDISGVKKNSATETYFLIETMLQGQRWGGVTVTLESGKRLERAEKEVVVTFKHPTPCLCPEGQHIQNRVVFQLEPDDGIQIYFWSKKPGLTTDTEERAINFSLYDDRERSQYVEEYAKLLQDCIAGDQSLFVSTEELREMWRFIDPVNHAWEQNLVPMAEYIPDSHAVRAAAIKAIEHERQLHVASHQVGIVGLGKMGAGLATQLLENNWQVVGYNRSPEPRARLAELGLKSADSARALVEQLAMPRVIWLMLPAGVVVDDFLFGEQGLAALLEPGDTVIDGGNSYYKDAALRAKKLKERGINFIDAGISGGPAGARYGACLMIGGEEATYQQLEPLFKAVSLPGAYQWFNGIGAGHFVKMIHNGIEYGMMQAIAEGFAVLKAASYELDLRDVATIYNNGSVIESRLVGWLKQAFVLHGPALADVTSTIAHTGEGAWTVEAAKELNIPAKIIEASLQFRIDSAKDPSYAGKVVSALRGQFGGHATVTPDQSPERAGM
jgi:glucose-6-phosphate 1-dehydrogenase